MALTTVLRTNVLHCDNMWYYNRMFILYNDSTTWSNDIEYSWHAYCRVVSNVQSEETKKAEEEAALRESNMIENKLQYVIMSNGAVHLSNFARELFVK